MTRTSSLLAIFLVAGCTDSAEVLVPDSGGVEGGVDAQPMSDAQAQPDQSSGDGAPADAPSDVGVDATDGGGADADAGCATGYELCKGVCTDVSTYKTDNTNCGFCMHDCQGNACTAGLCAPDTIGTGLPNPAYLTVDGTNVYFTTSGDGMATSGSVYQCPVGGCPSKLGPMTSSLNNPGAIAVDSSSVYWDNAGDLSKATGSVMSCPIAGCGKNDASRVTIASNLQFVLGLAVDSSNVYFGVWGASPFVGNGNIDSCPLAGCSSTPTTVIDGQYKPLFVARDGSDVFMAVGGGGASVPYVQSNPISTPGAGTRLYTGSISNQIAGFEIYGGQFYLTDNFGGSIYACAESGCSTLVTLVTGLSTPASLAVDSKGVYWIENGNSIDVCPLAGCTLPTTLATSTNYPQDVFVYGNYVYWVEQDSGGTAGQVMRVAR